MLCSASREQLESALGIPNMSNADDAEDGMKSMHEDVSKERTLFKNVLPSIQPDQTYEAKTNNKTKKKKKGGGATTYFDDRLRLNEVRSTPHNDRRSIVRRQRIHRLPQHLQIFKPTRAVCVDHQETVTARVKHPVSDRATLAKVLFERDDADVGCGVLSGKFEREGGGAVSRAVVDDEEFVCALVMSIDGCGCGGAEVCEGGVEHRGETRGFVVGRNDDAQIERPLFGERGEGEGCR